MKVLSVLAAALVAASAYLTFFVVPPAEGLGNLVRIAFFHIPVAWVSVVAFFVSAYYAVRYLRAKDLHFDVMSAASARLGLVFVVLATASGAFFAKLTWGAYWNWDPRQTTIFILLLIYGAYLTLRAAIGDAARRAHVCAVYAVLSFLTVPFLVFILPRLSFSLHPSPVLSGTGKVEMDPVMLATLLVALAAATLVYAVLLRRSARRASAPSAMEKEAFR